MILNSRLLPEEREVHIWLDDVDRKWKAEVSIGKYITKFVKAGWKEISRATYDDGQAAIITFEAPENGVSIRKPIKRKMSEEHKKAAAERMRKLVSKSKS